EETQGVQAKALKAIDDAIAEARQQMSHPRSSSSRQKGESRKAGQRDASRQQSKSSSAKPGAAASQSSGGPGAGPPKGSRLSERPDGRRGWGFLPQRDREAIVQGSNEEFQPRYREYIEQYYRAIAERAEQDK